MKKMLLVCLGLSLASLSSMAAPVLNKTIEPGLYTAVDVDSGTVVAQLVMRSNGTLNFKVKTPDFQMPEPGCEGVYTVVSDTFASNLKCPISTLPEVSVKINIANVTPQALRSQVGALVPVVIDALGTDPTMFRLKIVEPIQ